MERFYPTQNYSFFDELMEVDVSMRQNVEPETDEDYDLLDVLEEFDLIETA